MGQCDRPIYLPTGGGGNCKPWARLGVLTTAKGKATVICRRYWPEPGAGINPAGAGSGVTGSDASNTDPNRPYPNWKKNPKDALDPWVNDVAIIHFNPTNGATCFYQALGVIYGKRVPPPSEDKVSEADRTAHPQAKNAKGFWLTPEATANINCVNCHDADQVMHSPYARNVKSDSGGVFLYSKPRMPYKILGKEYGFGNWPITYNVKPKQANLAACNSCHRIGSVNDCQTWVRDAGAAQFHFDSSKTAFAKTFPQSHWMPADEEFANVDEWKASYEASYKKLIACCDLKKNGRKILGLAGNMFGDAAYENESVSPAKHDLNAAEIGALDAAGCSVTQITKILSVKDDPNAP